MSEPQQSPFILVLSHAGFPAAANIATASRREDLTYSQGTYRMTMTNSKAKKRRTQLERCRVVTTSMLLWFHSCPESPIG